MMAIRPPQFGQKEYWDEQYKQEKSFSWYTGWADLRPFWEEVIAPPTTAPRTSVTASHQRHTSVYHLCSCAQTGRHECWCRVSVTTRRW